MVSATAAGPDTPSADVFVASAVTVVDRFGASVSLSAAVMVTRSVLVVSFAAIVIVSGEPTV